VTLLAAADSLTTSATDQAVLLFLALVGLYSPIAALGSYLPIVAPFPPADQRRLAFGLFVNSSVFAMAAIWIGEPLLEVLGISTAALSATGGLALLVEGMHLMQGKGEEHALAPNAEMVAPSSWRSVLFTPVTFPLTVGGTTFGFFVAFSALTHGSADRAVLSIAGLAYAAVTGITLFLAGLVNRRISPSAEQILGRVAGILLTAIAVSLIASGGTRLVVDVFDGIHR
jgi:multiple antibiotic resistance protein